MDNKISVIVPTRNRSALLRATLRCVCDQTWPNCEIVVVDEASTDDTPEMLAAEFPQARVVRHEVPRGHSGARNAGLAASSGDWLFFLDDDDLIHPRHLEDLLRESLAAPTDCLVSGRLRDFAFVSEGVVLGPVHCAPANRSATDSLIEFLDPTSQRTASHSTILWPRAFFDKAKWDESLSFNEDFDLLCRAVVDGRRIVGREVGQYYVRIHHGPRVTTGLDPHRQLSPARYWLKWSAELQGRPEYRACAAAMRNGLMALVVDLSGVAVAQEFVPLLLIAFRAWGGRRFYLLYPPRNRLKRLIAETILRLGGPAVLRTTLALVARLRHSRETYVSGFKAPATDSERADAAFLKGFL